MSKTSFCSNIKTPFLFLLELSWTLNHWMSWLSLIIELLSYSGIISCFDQSVRGTQYLLELSRFFNKLFDFYRWVLAGLYHKPHCRKQREYKKFEKAFLVFIFFFVKTMCTKFFLLSWALCSLSSLFLHIFSFLSVAVSTFSCPYTDTIYLSRKHDVAFKDLVKFFASVLNIQPYHTSVISWKVLKIVKTIFKLRTTLFHKTGKICVTSVKPL